MARLAGPLPTLPPGGRSLDVPRFAVGLQGDGVARLGEGACAHPGSGAALCWECSQIVHFFLRGKVWV